MSKHKWFLFIVTLSLLLAACAGPAKPTAQPEQPTAVPEQPTKVPEPPTPVPQPKVATFIFTQEFDTLNPLYTNMWFSTITHQIWNCWAWAFDEVNNPLPVLV
jgi:hypothetical protein